MSVSLDLFTRAGQILLKDLLVSFLEVMGLAASGLEAGGRGALQGKAVGRPSMFSSLNTIIFSIVTLPSTVVLPHYEFIRYVFKGRVRPQGLYW